MSLLGLFKHLGWVKSEGQAKGLIAVDSEQLTVMKSRRTETAALWKCLGSSPWALRPVALQRLGRTDFLVGPLASVLRRKFDG